MEDYDEVFVQGAKKNHWWEICRDDVKTAYMLNSHSWAEELQDAFTSQAETSQNGRQTRLSSTSVSLWLMLYVHTRAHEHTYPYTSLSVRTFWAMFYPAPYTNPNHHHSSPDPNLTQVLILKQPFEAVRINQNLLC